MAKKNSVNNSKKFNLKKLNKNQKKLLLVGVGLLALIVIIGIIISIFTKPEEPSGNLNGGNVQEVNPDQATEMYSSLTEDCKGAYVWDLQPGETIEISNIKNSTACKAKDHFSKMIGYSYSDIGVVVYVNVLQNVNGQLQKLDGQVVGAYDETTLQDMLDLGTTFIYTFKESGSSYKLVQVEKMLVESPSPTEEEYTEEVVE